MELLLLSMVMGVAWMLSGILGGFLFALEINRQGLKIGGRGLAWIALGWGLGLGAGRAAGEAVSILVLPLRLPSGGAWRLVEETAYSASFGIPTGLVAGAIGGWVTLKVIRASAVSSQPSAIGQEQ